MTTLVDTLENHGITANADALVKAAGRAGVPLWIAAAFVEQETGGANVYGHDFGGAMRGAGVVTEWNYTNEFLPLIREGHTSNGVGPLQITWSGFFTDAARKGFKMWEPEDNMTYGLLLIKSYLAGSMSDEAIVNAGQRYNGARSYGYQVLSRALHWRNILSSTGSLFPLADGEWFGVDDGTASSHSGVRAGDSAYVEFIQNKVGVQADGIFGKLTDAAVKKWQSAHGLTADGKVGPMTWAAMHK